MKIKVGVFSATRAEYGLLSNLMKEIDFRKNLELQTFISGTHLSKDFGETYKDIEADGIKIDAIIEMSLSTETPYEMSISMSECLQNMTKKLNALKPNLLIILGDRYESFVACQAALISKIPIAHIHGGEVTEGAMDESFRHAISKMSHFHFVASEDFKKRVRQLGENPKNIWVTGALGIENISKLKLVKKNYLEKLLEIDLKEPIFLMTYHPVTLENDDNIELENLLSALSVTKGTLIITGTNVDPGSQEIKKIYNKFLGASHKDLKTHFFTNLGSINYLSLMSISDAVIGNSSSGVIEAPAIGIPSLDIGNRQKGRPRGPSVLHSDYRIENIKQQLKKVLSNEQKIIASKLETPYIGGNVAQKIVDVIENLSLHNNLKKPFYDI
jgi:UDP-hydrolysing UDP-N-acetyl-D-glucosamine 2-epimerase